MDLKSWYWFNELQMARQKSMAFLDAYEENLAPFVGKDTVLWEIGTGYPKSKQPDGCMGMGGSLSMFKEYLGPKSIVIGIDIIPECKEYENVDRKIFIEIGSQTDLSFLDVLISKYGCPDIVIDDGSHLDQHINITFTHIYPHLKCPGVHAIEDCFANHVIGDPSYDKDFDDPTRFASTSFSHILQMNQQYRRKHASQQANVYQKSFNCTAFGFMTTSIKYYPNLIIYNKGVNCVHDQLPGPPHYEL